MQSGGRKYFNKKHSAPRKSVFDRSVARVCKSVIAREAEKKYTTANLSGLFGAIGSAAWTEVELTGVSQGDQRDQREGNSIFVRGVRINGVLSGAQSNLATDDSSNVVRIILALWDSKSATPCQANAMTRDAYLDPANVIGVGLIHKYLDIVVPLASPGRDSTGYMRVLKRIQEYVRVNRKITFYGNAAANSNQKLILSMLSDSVIAVHPGFTQGDLTLLWNDI